MISDGDSDSECKAIYETNSIPISNKVHYPTTRALKRRTSSITRGVHLGDQDNVVISKKSHVSFRKTKDKIDYNINEEINEETKKIEKKKTLHKIVGNIMAVGDIDYGHHEGFDLNSYVPKSKTQLLPTTTTTTRKDLYSQRDENGPEISSIISTNHHQNLRSSNSSMPYTPSKNKDHITNTTLQHQHQHQEKSNNKSLMDKNLQNKNQNYKEVNGNVHNKSVIDHPAHWSSGKVPKLTKNRNSSTKGNAMNSFTISSFSKMKSSIIKDTGTTTSSTSVFPSPSTNNKKRRESYSSTATQSASTISFVSSAPRLSFQPSWLTAPKPSSVNNPTREVSEPFEDIMNGYDDPLPTNSITPLLLQTVPRSPSTSLSHIPPYQVIPNQTNQLAATTDTPLLTNLNLISSPQPTRSHTAYSPVSSSEKMTGYKSKSRAKHCKYNNKHNGKLSHLFQRISRSIDMDENRIASVGVFAASSNSHLLDDIRDKAKHWIDVTVTGIRPFSRQAFVVTTIYLHQKTYARRPYAEEEERNVALETFPHGSGGGGGGGQMTRILGSAPDTEASHGGEGTAAAPSGREERGGKEIPGYATAYFKSHLVQGQAALAIGAQLRMYDAILLPGNTAKVASMRKKSSDDNRDNALPVIVCTALCEAYPGNAPPLVTPMDETTAFEPLASVKR